jgi:hypothetical protein
VRLDFRDWKKKLGREVDLKETLLVERMKVECGNNSTDKEFYGIVPIEDNETDLSGAPAATTAAAAAAAVPATGNTLHQNVLTFTNL